MPLLVVEDLTVEYARTGGRIVPVDGVSFSVAAGETVGLVGESGCGKSTLAKAILRLVPITSGRIVFEATDITTLGRAAMRPLRQRMQIVFQASAAAFNPRQTVGSMLAGMLAVNGVPRALRRARIATALDGVHLPSTAIDRYPHEFSGGQRQRISIARALIVRPSFVICDEPVSALDLAIQSQILNLLADLQRDYQLSYLFISHDLGVVRYIADRVLVMSGGKIVETGDHVALWESPQHPYTRRLLAAAPGHRRRQPESAA